MAKLEDFGEKIGGARKDMYASCNIDLLNDAELEGVTRDKIWKRPNIKKLIDEGVDPVLLYWKEQVRKAIPPKPLYNRYYEKSDLLKGFICVTNAVKDFVEAAETIDQEGLAELAKPLHGQNGYWMEPTCAEGASIGIDLLNLTRRNATAFERGAARESFGKTPSEKKADEVRKSFDIIKYLGVLEKAPENDGSLICYFIKSELETQEEPHKIHFASTYMRGTYYIYSYNDAFFNVDNWKEGTYAVTCARKGVVVNNLDSEDDAKACIETAVQIEIQKTTEKSGKGKKKGFPFQLINVVQEGGATLSRPAAGDDYLNTFHFRGGEFGNWMNEQDRQVSMNMGYIALVNLAYILGISDENISLKNLAIAFGARGHSAARAHYEPSRNVINLTKMTGAGSLAHEWGHALDAYLGEIATGSASLYTGTSPYRRKVKFDAMEKVIHAMKYKPAVRVINHKEIYEQGVEKCRRYLLGWLSGFESTDLEEGKKIVEELLTNPPSCAHADDPTILKLSALRKSVRKHGIPKSDRETIAYKVACTVYYPKKSLLEKGEVEETKTEDYSTYFKGSKKFDGIYSKNGGYWSSPEEMFARAFDCYVKDKLEEAGIKDTYLSGYADAFHIKDGGEDIYAYPTGEERKALNVLFDELIEEIISKEYLSQRKEGTAVETCGTEQEPETNSVFGGGKAKDTDEISSLACAKAPVQMTIFDFL